MQIKVNGIDINYELEGSEEGSVVVFSHSLMADLSMWEAQAAALAGRYRVLRFDTRGHGGSTARAGAYSLEMLSDDVEALLDALDLGPVHFVGLSMGGMIGQTLALRAPERLESLVLCDTSSRIPPDAGPMWQERIDTAQNQGMAALAEGTLDRWFSPEFKAAQPAQVEGVRQMILATEVLGFVGCCHAISQLDLTEQISAIEKPTQIIVGSDDEGTPVAAHEVIRDQIKGSELCILKGARHLSNIESVDEFNQALVAFLDRQA